MQISSRSIQIYVGYNICQYLTSVNKI